MNVLFSILSIAYIAGIFLFADSPMVSDIATFSPYSLLHIPLYGVLTLLLVFSFSRPKRRLISPIGSTNSRNSINAVNPINYLIAGIIAFVVAIADEIHQAYIPKRHASIIDVFLDVIGIIICLLFIYRFWCIPMFSKAKLFFRQIK